jgi:hypothetical protein
MCFDFIGILIDKSVRDEFKTKNNKISNVIWSDFGLDLLAVFALVDLFFRNSNFLQIEVNGWLLFLSEDFFHSLYCKKLNFGILKRLFRSLIIDIGVNKDFTAFNSVIFSDDLVDSFVVPADFGGIWGSNTLSAS